ncbi:hypothetical protein J4230_02395 [Candidatus Woesearchaeota archaeon]|nr:hypothetical protein [Candidatus Woesearchaeota archaeon]
MKGEVCDECRKGKFIKKKIDYILVGINLGKFYAWVCSNCGETIFEGKESLKIENKAKQQGVWGLAAKTKIGTSGTALDVRFSRAIVNFMKLKKGKEVVVQPIDKNKIQITVSS